MRNSIHINGRIYFAQQVVEEWIAKKNDWQQPGWEMILQLLDPSEGKIEFHTSGTTSEPKQVFYTKTQIETAAKNTCDFFGITENDTLLLVLPTDFVAGKMMIARCMVSGAKLLWQEPTLLPLQESSACSFAAFTPAQVTTIITDKNAGKRFKEINTVIIGGGTI